MNHDNKFRWRAGWMLMILAAGLLASPAWAFFDGFENYADGTTFTAATNGW